MNEELREIISKCFRDLEEVDCPREEYEAALAYLFHKSQETCEMEDVNPTAEKYMLEG